MTDVCHCMRGGFPSQEWNLKVTFCQLANSFRSLFKRRVSTSRSYRSQAIFCIYHVARVLTPQYRPLLADRSVTTDFMRALEVVLKNLQIWQGNASVCQSTK